MKTEVDPFAGWTMANVGCHWSRQLPDGQMVYMSTWACGNDSGYALTVNYERTDYSNLDEALAAYEEMAR